VFSVCVLCRTVYGLGFRDEGLGFSVRALYNAKHAQLGEILKIQ
jgi:hypothetical protein